MAEELKRIRAGMKPERLGVESIRTVQLNPSVLSVRVVKYKLELGFHILFDEKTDLVLFVMDYDSMGLTSVVRTEVEPERLLESEERLALIVGGIIEEYYYISYGEKYRTLKYEFLFKNTQKMFGYEIKYNAGQGMEVVVYKGGNYDRTVPPPYAEIVDEKKYTITTNICTTETGVGNDGCMRIYILE